MSLVYALILGLSRGQEYAGYMQTSLSRVKILLRGSLGAPVSVGRARSKPTESLSFLYLLYLYFVYTNRKPLTDYS